MRLWPIALGVFLLLAACGEGNFTFPGAEGEDEPSLSDGGGTEPTATPDASPTPSGTPATPPSFCADSQQSCLILPCCSGTCVPGLSICIP